MMSTSTQTLQSCGKTVQRREKLKPPPDNSSDNNSDNYTNLPSTKDTSLHTGQQSAQKIKAQ
jgi:hypothetical protein